MKNLLVYFIIVFLAGTSCQKEMITTGTNASETFYVENNGASMRVLVEGNTASRILLIFVPGGPGTGAFFYNTEYIRTNIGDKYALVYWDERNSGASQGSSNGGDLTLAQMTDDLTKVIRVLKARYGQDCILFLLGHSFGGLLTSSFMTTGTNQSEIKGWIFTDGSHNYPLNDSLTRQMLLTTAEQQISFDRNKSNWEKIVAFCKARTGNFSYDESVKLLSYANEAENYIDEITKIKPWAFFTKYAFTDKWPLTSMVVNYTYSTNAGFNRDLARTEFSSALFKVTVPVLVLCGKYDFVCPSELGTDFYNRIGSTDKKIVISPVSGHNIVLQDEILFANEINNFIGSHR